MPSRRRFDSPYGMAMVPWRRGGATYAVPCGTALVSQRDEEGMVGGSHLHANMLHDKACLREGELEA